MSESQTQDNSGKSYAESLRERLIDMKDFVISATGNFTNPTIPAGGALALALLFLGRAVIKKSLISGLYAFKKWRMKTLQKRGIREILENESILSKLRRKHPKHDKKAQEDAQTIIERQESRLIPDITDFMSVVVKVVNKEGKPIEAVPGLKEGRATSSNFLRSVWKIIGETIGKNEEIIEPELDLITNGALSFYFLPIPWNLKNEDVVKDLENKLKNKNYIKDGDAITFQTYMHKKKILPQLFITVTPPFTLPKAPPRTKVSRKPLSRRTR